LTVQNNTNKPTKTYEITSLIEVNSICNTQLNHIRFNRGFIHTTNPTYSMCAVVNDTINLVLGFLRNYFSQPLNPLSLYHNLSGNQQYVHPMLMSIIRTRQQTIYRSGLTSHLAGGGKYKGLKTLKRKKQYGKCNGKYDENDNRKTGGSEKTYGRTKTNAIANGIGKKTRCNHQHKKNMPID
jgi:hypothetical protein